MPPSARPRATRIRSRAHSPFAWPGGNRSGGLAARRLGLACRMPDAVAGGGDRLHLAPRDDAALIVLDERIVAAGPGIAVALLDEQPVARIALAAHAHQRPAAFEPLAPQHEFERAVLEFGDGITAGRQPQALVPHHDRAAAIFALRDDALEIDIVDGMVLDLAGEALHRGIEAQSFGHRPAFQDARHLQAEIEMEMACRVLLHDKAQRFQATLLDAALGLGRPREIALSPVFLEAHARPLAAPAAPSQA